MFNFDWLHGLSDGWGKFLVILAFVAPLIFALTMKKSYIYQGAEDKKPWRNLKIWVFVIVALQVASYVYF